MTSNLSIIIPVFNEVDNITKLYQEIKQVLEANNFCYEVIFIDDGSTDGTKECLQLLADDTLRVLIHNKNFGQSAALVTGAKAARYPLLVTLDGDGQNDPADIPILVAFFTDPQTAVLGKRQKRDDNLVRRISSRVANKIRQFFLKDQCNDTGCSLKVFSRDIFLSLPHFDHLHRFLPTLFMRAGIKIINVPVNHRPRMHGVSKYGILDRLFVGIHDLFGVHWLLKRPCAPEVQQNE